MQQTLPLVCAFGVSKDVYFCSFFSSSPSSGSDSSSSSSSSSSGWIHSQPTTLHVTPPQQGALTKHHVLVAISPTKVALAIAPEIIIHLLLGRRRRVVEAGHLETLRDIALAVLDVFLDDALEIIGITTEHNGGVDVGGRRDFGVVEQRQDRDQDGEDSLGGGPALLHTQGFHQPLNPNSVRRRVPKLPKPARLTFHRRQGYGGSRYKAFRPCRCWDGRVDG